MRGPGRTWTLRGLDRQGRIVACIVAAGLALPYVAAAVRARSAGWLPSGDAGMIGLFARDVLHGPLPLVGTPTRKPFWRIFGLRLLTAMLVGAASSVVMVPLMIVMMIVMFALLDNGGTLGDVYMLQTVLTGVIGIIAGALTTPFTAGLDALLYVDARMRTEGLDVTLMRAAEGTIAPPWQAAEQA